MGLFNFFRRKKGVVSGIGEMPLGMSEDGEEGEGGPHFFRTDIAQLRWAAQGAAVEVVNSDPDPMMWPGAQMVFDAERASAFGHEGLRDRLSNKVAMELREVVGELYSLAAGIATTRVELQTVDRSLAYVDRIWTTTLREVEDDPIELGRYFRHKNSMTRIMKAVIAMLFIISELMLTFKLFEHALGIDDQAQLMVFSLGLLTLFVAVPHFAAHGIKEGLTKHHTHLRQAYIEAKQPVPVGVNRSHHMEEQDDHGFRWIAGLTIVVLAMLIVPLSILRGRELNNGDGLLLWAALYFLLQLSISSYFFLREWLDHGNPSSTLYKIEQAREALQAERDGLLEDLTDQVAEFNEEGQQIAFWIREAPRWDSYIVTSFYQTLHHFRHVVSIGRPDLAPFVTNATKPYLGSRADAPSDPHNLDALANDMPSLDRDGLFGRTWWMDNAGAALAALPAVSIESGELAIPASDAPISWLLSNSPAQILAGFLEMVGVPFHYRQPASLEATINPDPSPSEEAVSIDFPVEPPPPHAANGSVTVEETKTRKVSAARADKSVSHK